MTFAAVYHATAGFFDALRCELVGEGGLTTITLAYPGAVQTEINATRLGGTTAAAGTTDLDLGRSMSAERCAAIMATAHAGGARDVYFSTDGSVVGAIKGRLIHAISFWCPALADKLVISTMKQMNVPK